MKKFLSLLLSVIIVFSALAMTAYAKNDNDEIVNAALVQYDLLTDDADRVINWYEKDGEYYFFVPASIIYEIATVEFETKDDSDVVSIDGVEYTKNLPLSVVFGDKKSVTVTCDGETYPVTIIRESKVASVFITTESGSLDYIHEEKGNEESGMIEIVDSFGVTIYDDVLDSIKGRGNSTWKMAKKPYNLKLDSKENLFGMGKSKKWSLIANHSDLSLLRNAFVYGVAGEILPYSPKYEPVDLYINDNYQGSYLLTTRVEAADNRVEIENLDDANEDANPDVDFDELPICGVYGTYAGLLQGTKKWVDIPNDPEDISGGYLMELEIADRYPAEISGFVTDMGQPVIFKSAEYATESEINYISSFFQDFEDGVFSEDGKNSKGVHYTEIADIESFWKFYVINEWSSNQDCGLTSTYMYKPEGEDKLYAGPVWDFDIALANNDGNRYGCDYTNPNEFTVCFGRQFKNTIFGGEDVMMVPTIFNRLCQREEFVKGAKSVWDNEIRAAVEKWNSTELDAYAAKIEGSAVMNAIYWDIFGTDDIEEIKEAYAAEVKKVKDFSVARTEFLTKNLGTVQVQEYQINPVKKFFMDIGTGINNAFEKLIVVFGLENKI